MPHSTLQIYLGALERAKSQRDTRVSHPKEGPEAETRPTEVSKSKFWRVPPRDGDTAPGDFDVDENDLFINGVSFGDFNDGAKITTDSLGNNIGAAGTGFEDDQLDTVFFLLNNATSLAALFAGIVSTQTLAAALFDVDPDDNFFDFTQGIDGGLINVGSGPVITPPNPVPAHRQCLGLLLVA